MKWIKTAIGAVISIATVPIIVLSTINIKNSLSEENDEITFTFNISYMDYEDGDYYYFDAFNLPNDGVIYYLDNDYNTNLKDNTHEINITITDYYYDEYNNITLIDNNSVMYVLGDNTMDISMTYDSIYSVNATSITSIDITFTKQGNENILVSTLLSLLPIVFIGGILLYFYKTFRKE